MDVQDETQRYSPLVAAGVFLGLGLGGFFDGILLHQILQWHHMLSSIRPPISVPDLELNMVGDGLFEAGTWLMTIVGVVLLWQAGKREDVAWSSRTFFGSILIGAGLFNLVEGLIDHQILAIHHVKPGSNELIWDVGFLVVGVMLAIVGWLLIRADKRRSHLVTDKNL
ncbi:DUF2243 domain-containing protein [Gloeocapsopsis dulcis]|uniref:DUF2243 domain-containing protein n=1 Tax=Gloeocapsopsis dulcis AAB1 = 1H9 TaxID=1433147 RepID=A0A6N8FRV7_9CHRO|nr:DUF2243 domain-containing protein [Gloeocapsopsis dulcis]MUL35691.1 hypothetical protein [Gloeocapsopsis dulcis AAB1 = 1H9]WNN91027.1 DUF2243 domain-containing protein [Gloeocapsopsis dulcis]